MKERIQKILSARGLASRRKAEEWIAAGRVTCNGNLCQLGDSADPETDVLCIDGKPLPTAGERLYIMLHKPRGFVTTLSDEKGRRNAAELVADCGQRVYPIGRLDMDTEGLLLFTNDGDFSNRLMHPSHEVSKTYLVLVDKLSEEALNRLREPVVLDGYQIQPPQVRLISSQGSRGSVEIVIHEGRNRQVRRMCAMAGLSVVALKRIAEGGVTLGTLPKGKWRHLTPQELALLSDHT